jgi:hypothetical protein
VDVAWRSGWLSDRAATFLAMGRPVVTEDTGAARHLPECSGFFFVHNVDSAAESAGEVISHWNRLSATARATAAELFDGPKNLRKILTL